MQAFGFNSEVTTTTESESDETNSQGSTEERDGRDKESQPQIMAD